MFSTRKKVILNTGTSLLYQVVTVAYGFIIPRLIISNYGSDMNGWVSAIVKFLSLISVCEFGIGAVIKANLYKPLYDNDKTLISQIIKSANKFFCRIGIVFLFYTITLIILFPLFRSNPYGIKDNTLMILVISLGTFSQYFFGMSSQLLLEADQRNYITNLINIGSSIAEISFSFILIGNAFSLLMVRIVYAIIYSIRPVCIFLYTKKRYNLDLKHTKITGEPIKQKWNGFSLHIAQIVQNNTDTMVLTIFSTIANVSVYTVYHLASNGLSVLVNIVTQAMTPVFGRLIASENTKKLQVFFSHFEWFFHMLTMICFSTCIVSILPFISIYTRGVSDVNYANYEFGLLLSISMCLYCISQLYVSIINAAGRFKETAKYFILEPIINIILSVLSVRRFGLIGVTIGTIVALIYKILYLTIYLKREILCKKLKEYLRLALFDFLIAVSIVLISHFIPVSNRGYITWAINSIEIVILGLVCSLGFSVILFRSHVKWAVSEIKGIICRSHL